MCGIVAYIGEAQAEPILRDGIRALEHRGYDSHGYAIIGERGVLRRYRYIGGITDNTRWNHKPAEGTIGIGHTRWATHGSISIKNTHPIKYGNWFVVHNGVIKNYEGLKEELVNYSDCGFKTETDTEIIAALLSFYGATNEILDKIEGDFAFVAFNKVWPNELYLSRRGLPLYRTPEGIVSSESVMLSNPKLIPENEFIRITREDVVRQPEALPPKKSYLPPEPNSIMLSEIREQPEIFRKAIFKPEMCEFQKVFLFGCGSSWHAALFSRKFFEAAGIQAEVEYASEVPERHIANRVRNTRFIALTQSGETADTIKAIRHVKYSGGLTLCITNNICSLAANEATKTIELNCEPEYSVASTKTFSRQCQVLAMLAGAEVTVEPDKFDTLIKTTKQFTDAAKFLTKFNHCLCLGQGLRLPIAMEGALKLKEVAYLHAEAMPASEMKHGPIALIDKDTVSIFVLGQYDPESSMLPNMHEIKARGGKIMTIGTKKPSLSDYHIHVPCENSFVMAPLLDAVAFQLLAYYTGLERGIPVDRPRNLAKCCTV